MVARNTDYDDIVNTAEHVAYDRCREEVLQEFLQTHPQGATTPEEENLYKAMVAKKWQDERQLRISATLVEMGYPLGSEVHDYYVEVWEPAFYPPAEEPAATRPDRPPGGEAPPEEKPAPIASTAPTLPSVTPNAIERSTTEGPPPALLPIDMGDNAYLAVDPDSYGGKAWLEALNRSNLYYIGDRLLFQFIGQDEFPDVASPQYSTNDVLGRSESYYTFDRTATREFNITLKFVAQGAIGDTMEKSLLFEVKNKTDWCRALAYPVYVDGIMYPPPRVKFAFGKMYSRIGQALACLVTSVNVTYCTDSAPLDVETKLPYAALVDIGLACVFTQDATSNPLDATSIMSGEF